jgi:hypothetical protein
MPKSAIDIKKASIEKDLQVAIHTAKYDAELKKARVMGELQYSEIDFQEREKEFEKDRYNLIQEHENELAAMRHLYNIKLIAVGALMAIITSIALHFF